MRIWVRSGAEMVCDTECRFSARLGFSRAGNETSDTTGNAVLYGNGPSCDRKREPTTAFRHRTTLTLSSIESTPGSSSLKKKRKLFPGSLSASPSELNVTVIMPRAVHPERTPGATNGAYLCYRVREY